MEFGPLALSLIVAFVATLLAGLVGIPLGALLSRRFPGREMVDALVTAPMVLPPTVLGYYLVVAIGRESPIGQAWESLTGGPLVFSFAGLVLAAFIGALPFVVKAARAALEDVDPRLVAAARTLGASRTRAFVSVALPLARRGLVAGLSLGFARALGDFGVTLMVSGSIPGETKTASLAIYDAVMADRGADAAGLIALMTALAVVALLAANRLLRRPATRATSARLRG